MKLSIKKANIGFSFFIRCMAIIDALVHGVSDSNVMLVESDVTLIPSGSTIC